MGMSGVDQQLFYNKDYFEGVSRQSPPHTKERMYPEALRTAEFLFRQYHPFRVLDIGCAKGYLAEAFLASGVPIVCGIDISLYAVGKSDSGVMGKLVVADVQEAIPITSNSCDLITSLDVFEHLPNPGHLLQEIRRVLTNHGCAFLKICHPRHPNATRDPSHINVQALPYWKRAFEVNGLKYQRIYESELTPGTGVGYRIRSLVRLFREWAVIGNPADYKFVVWKADGDRHARS